RGNKQRKSANRPPRNRNLCGDRRWPAILHLYAAAAGERTGRRAVLLWYPLCGVASTRRVLAARHGEAVQCGTAFLLATAGSLGRRCAGGNLDRTAHFAR